MSFEEPPFVVIWEVTQACDLACVHCRASAEARRHPLELTTQEGERLTDQVAAMKVSAFVLTGGDPLKRPDIYHLVEYATRAGVRTSVTPSATPLLTRAAIAQLGKRGLARLALSLDSSTADIHDAFRGVAGSYAQTLQAVQWAHELGLPVQINTTVTRRNLHDLDAIIRLLQTLDIMMWSVFFLVPTGRAQVSDLITAEEFEGVFEKLYELAARAPFDIKTTEAPHYRRYALQKRVLERRGGGAPHVEVAGIRPPHTLSAAFAAADVIGRGPLGVGEGKGFVFVSHLGEVMPSGFLPISGGNVRRRSLAGIYRQSPLFVGLRDTANLKGKCGVCEFREICGGSRARSYALTGDVFAEEPCCVYQPQAVMVQ